MYNRNNRAKLCSRILEIRKANKCIYFTFACVIVYAFVAISRANWNLTNQVANTIRSASIYFHQSLLQPSTKEFYTPIWDGYNHTHLWSMRLADNNYTKLAYSIPCETVQYIKRDRPEKMDSCDESPKNEFSMTNLLEAQKWIYEHQHPMNCSNKRFAIIHQFAWSGFGSTVHQIAWALGVALSENRIAVYQSPGNWLYGSCSSANPDCYFLPISNCSVPSTIDANQTVYVSAGFGYWNEPILPPVFQNRSFHWYRSQLTFYIMRLKPQILNQIQQSVSQNFPLPSINFYRPYVAIYIRRSDKVKFGEMSQAYTLKQYFDLFDNDARLVNMSTVYINSEDANVFNEFIVLNREKQNYYQLLTINVTRNVVYAEIRQMSNEQREKIVLEFLTDLYVEVHADLHVGTLTSNWCRLVDELRLVLGKTILFYTPEKKYLSDW